MSTTPSATDIDSSQAAEQAQGLSSDTEAIAPEDSQEKSKSQRRQASVYDAVAGLIGPNGFLSPEQLAIDTLKPLTPLEVILRRLNAPEPELLTYNTQPPSRLPSSDLLKDAHRYASEFYANLHADTRSLDGTALLAVGILIEEACRANLGQAGDLVLTEGSHAGQEDRRARQVIGTVSPESVVEYESSSSERSVETQPRKRARRRYSEYIE